jgi:hypothetical protein
MKVMIKTMMKRLFVIGISALLSGCSIMSLSDDLVDRSMILVGLGPNHVESIGVMTIAGNARHATAFEIAFAYGDAAQAVVSGSEVSLWFEERMGFCRSYANQLDVIRVELPMGYSAQLDNLPKGHKGAQAIWVFSEGLGKADLTTFTTPWIVVSEEGLSVTEAPPGAMEAGKTLVADKGVKKLC